MSEVLREVSQTEFSGICEKTVGFLYVSFLHEIEQSLRLCCNKSLSMSEIIVPVVRGTMKSLLVGITRGRVHRVLAILL